MKRKIIQYIKSIYTFFSKTPLVYLMSICYQVVDWIEYRYYDFKWKREGYELPDEDDRKLICNNVTFIFKSFERQRLAKRLYKSIQAYYPGVKVIIADDSREELNITGENLEIIHLPFNSGLSYGLQMALDKVSTPYVIRMDDDQLLTRRTCFHKQLAFLMAHDEVDLVGVLQFTTPVPRQPEIAAEEFFKSNIHNIKKLLIPHMTYFDKTHVVVGKCSNVFVSRIEKLKMIGYDSNIRMIDHHDFFIRAAGKIVSVLDVTCLVHHSHNRFAFKYEKFRNDIGGDKKYITSKKY